MKKFVALLRVAGAVLAGLGLTTPLGAQTPMPLTDLTIGMYRIEAEVAASETHRELGLMHRRAMAQNHGMVFVFEQRYKHCMWMRNTLLPLSVAFIDERGVIINVEDMQPQTDDNHCAAREARYALEMNLGWFKQRGFSAGTPVRGLEHLRAIR